MNIRAVKHDGQILFLVDDIAKIYGGNYSKGAFGLNDFKRHVLGKMRKISQLKELSHASIISSSKLASNELALNNE